MKNKRILIVTVLLIAVLLLGIGYAAISNINLNINGTASATISDANFKVKFTGTPTVSDATKVTAAVTDDLNATIDVTGLTAKGDKATATYTILNDSPDLGATLTATTSLTGTNADYFNVTYAFANESLAKGEDTTITVTVELLKTPVESDVTATVGVTITAAPVQPWA